MSEITVISLGFSHAGEDSIVEVTYGEDRDQSTRAGIIKTSTADVGASPVIRQLCEQIQDLGEELVSAIYTEVHKPAPTRPSARFRDEG